MAGVGKFLAGGLLTIAAIGTIVIVKLINEAGKTLRQELANAAAPDAK